MTATETLILASYFFVLLILAVYGWHRYYLVYIYMKHKHEQPKPKAAFDDLPVVTIQLPLYNEMYVVDRLVDSVCQIDYPREKLEIQVLAACQAMHRERSEMVGKLVSIRNGHKSSIKPGPTASNGRLRKSTKKWPQRCLWAVMERLMKPPI